MLWQCIHIEPDGLAIFRQNDLTFASFGNGYVLGNWYKLTGNTLQAVVKGAPSND